MRLSAGCKLVLDASEAVLYAYSLMDGIFKSTDGGVTWSRAGIVSGVWGVSVDPSKAGTAYAVVTSSYVNLYKTTDWGATWTMIASNLNDLTFRTLVMTAGGPIAVDPRDSSVLYAPISGSCSGQNSDCGIFKSTDAGKTWRNLGLTGTYNNIGFDPSTGEIYAAGKLSVFTGHIARSGDAGASWSNKNAGLTISDLEVRLDPGAASVAYAFQHDFSRASPTLAATTYGGDSWTMLSSPAGEVLDIAVVPSPRTAGKPIVRAVQGVLQAFNGGTTISSGTWISIYGADFTTRTQSWAGSDFVGNHAPVALGGVRVNVNGRAAFVSYVSPNQVNAQVPDDPTTGPVPVQVIGPGGTSDEVTVTKTSVSPALLTTPAFNANGRQYVVAMFPDFATYVGPAGLIAGVPFRPASAGESIILFAVGCGPTTPSTPAGQFFPEARPLASPYQVKIGGTVAITSASLAGGAVGLCQLNVTVPSAPSGDAAIEFAVTGVPTAQSLYVTVR